MTGSEATAEVFWTAFRALPRKDRDAVIARLAQDKRLRRDLIDIAIASERLNDPARPLSAVINEIKGGK